MRVERQQRGFATRRKFEANEQSFRGEHLQSRSEPLQPFKILFITILPAELLTGLMKSTDWYRDNDTPGLLSNALGVDGDYDAPERNCRLQ
jgi:hypothetical protein